MPNDPTSTSKSSWRPRFSLRTLTIGVLILGFSWTSTVVWGVAGVGESMKSIYPVFAKSETGGYAPLPFVVYAKLSYRAPNQADRVMTQHRDELWFWCFGLKIRIGSWLYGQINEP